MAWIELHQAVWTHRKTFELAGLLDLDETYAASHVIRLWSWALDNAPDGDLSSLSARAIAFGAGWRGDADTFVDALIGAGWVDPDRRIHDWDQYAGRMMERRQLNAERQKRSRDRVRLPIYQRDVGCCRYCGKSVPEDGFIVDHIFPFRRGGSDDQDNLATACPPCNTRKNNRTPEEAGMPLLSIPPRNASSNAHAVKTEALRVGLPDRTGPDTTIPDHTGPEPDLTGPDALELDGDGGAGGDHGADAPPKPKRAKPRGTKPRTDPPETLEPNDADYAAGARVGLSRDEVDSKVATMLDYHRREGKDSADWHASLRTWLDNARLYDQPRASQNGHRNGSSKPPPNGQTALESRDASKYFETRGGTLPRR